MSLNDLFKMIAAIISVYTMICFIRIFLTWIPSASYSSFGRFLSTICDPYLNLFRKFRFLRIGMVDFSAMAGICVLWGLSYIFNALATGEKITIGLLLALIVAMIWNIFSSILSFFAVFLLIRLVVLLVSKSTYGTIWDTVDRTISPIIFSMTSMFYKGRSISFKGAIVIAMIECLVFYMLGKILVERMLIPLLGSLPF